MEHGDETGDGNDRCGGVARVSSPGERARYRRRSPHRSILHEVTGAGLSHRVVVSRRSWWRLENGGVVLYIVGADDLATDLEGTRVLCLRPRWTITPGGAAGTVAILQETVSDPRPPFGLTGLVTEEPLPDVSARFASCLLGS